jgi:GxxExxY protein
MLEHEALTERIIGAAIEVHRALGPGLLESAYEACLVHELSEREIQCKRQVALPVRYKGKELDCGYRLDIVVADLVIVELKRVDKLIALHTAQVLTYLRLSGMRVGLLITNLLKNGITRVVL